MPDAPNHLHVHDLYEDEPAWISWDVVNGAAGYILERHFNQTFEQAMKGRTWSNIDAASQTWAEMDSAGLNWEQIEELSTLGFTWENINYAGLTWTQIEAKNLTWQQTELQPTSSEIFRGAGTEEYGFTWTELEDEDLSWAQIEAKNQAWDQIGSMSLHRSATDKIIIGARTAIYRVAAYDSFGTESDYLTGNIIPVIPVYYRDDRIQWQAEAGVHYWLVVNGRRLKNIDRIPLTLRYQAENLTLDDFMAQLPGKQIKPGIYPTAHLQIFNSPAGEVRFKCTRQVPARKVWSGCITVIHFIAKKTGLACAEIY